MDQFAEADDPLGIKPSRRFASIASIANAHAQFGERSLPERLILVMAACWVLNMVLVAIPGHFSHDELDWMHLIRTHYHGWDFWLADVHNSPFFRPLGTVLISKALRLPLQPFATHALLVFAHGC